MSKIQTTINDIISKLQKNNINPLNQDGYSLNKAGLFNLFIYAKDEQAKLYIYSDIFNIEHSNESFLLNLYQQCLSFNLINKLPFNYKLALNDNRIFLIACFDANTLNAASLDNNISEFINTATMVYEQIQVTDDTTIQQNLNLANNDNVDNNAINISQILWG